MIFDLVIGVRAWSIGVARIRGTVEVGVWTFGHGRSLNVSRLDPWIRKQLSVAVNTECDGIAVEFGWHDSLHCRRRFVSSYESVKRRNQQAGLTSTLMYSE